MNLINDILIKCNYCHKTIKVDKDDIEVETYSHERGMGAEIAYDFYGEYQCYKCFNNIELRVSGYEYPSGILNYTSKEIYGGEFIVNPELEISYYAELDDETIQYFLPIVHQNILKIMGDKDNIYKLTPREFEEVVEEVFKQEGFNTVLTKQTRDGGRDIIASKSLLGKPFIVIIECKRYSNTNKVGVEIVRQLYGVHVADQANKSIIVTSSYFSKDAKEFAGRQNTLIDLIDIDELFVLLQNCII